MKGLVFSEFLEFVELSYSMDMVDDIIEAAGIPSNGVFTSVGTYDHRELIYLVAALSDITGVPAPDLVQAFGRHLFNRLATSYPDFISGSSSVFEFLRSVEDYIHVEVRKLYSDAELPVFQYESPSPDELVVIYHSKRALGDLAHGMMEGACDYFGEKIEIRKDSKLGSYGTSVRFVLTRKD